MSDTMNVESKSRVWPLLISIIPTAFLSACEKIPGANAHQIKQAQELAARKLFDPFSAQFRDLRVRGNAVCGDLNGKNRLGAYVGFRRFYVLSQEKSASIDPMIDVAELQSAREQCDTAIADDDVSAATAQSTCNRVRDRLVDNLVQNVFDVAWAKHCEGKSIKLEGPAPDTRSTDVSKAEPPAEGLTEDEEVWGVSGEGHPDPIVDENGNPVEPDQSSDTSVSKNNGSAGQSRRSPPTEDPLDPGS